MIACEKLNIPESVAEFVQGRILKSVMPWRRCVGGM